MSPRAKKPAEKEATEKSIILTAIRPGEGQEWQEEPLLITSHQVTPSGVLMLFHRRSIIRVLAPGAWWEVVLIGESALTEEPKKETTEV